MPNPFGIPGRGEGNPNWVPGMPLPRHPTREQLEAAAAHDAQLLDDYRWLQDQERRLREHDERARERLRERPWDRRRMDPPSEGAKKLFAVSMFLAELGFATSSGAPNVGPGGGLPMPPR
jgi:hypothetical protein